MSPSPPRCAPKWPFEVEPGTLRQLLAETQGREIVLEQLIHTMEERYGGPLETLKQRLARGEGPEHPDWEDAIEWRNAFEALQRTQALRNILEWLISSRAPSPVS
jgi:hypothetical protein